MKHVLSLTTLYPNSVSPRTGVFVARSMEALAKHGKSRVRSGGSRAENWHVTVINPIGIPPVALGRYRELVHLEPYREERGIAVHRPRFTLMPRLGERRHPGAIAKTILPVIERIHGETPIDLVAAQLAFPDGPAAASIAQHLGVPLSIKARGRDVFYWGEQDFAREQMLAAACRADGMLAISDALKNDMVRLGMDANRITVHRTGLDRDRFRPLDHDRLRAQLAAELDFALPVNAPLLTCVGTLCEYNGQDIAIASLAGIEGARLVLAGEGEDEPHLRALAQDLGLAERVHFAGSLDHDMLPLILSAADAMVLPATREGLANPWVESLACGTPVVTTDTGGAREIITDHSAGRLVERSPEAVAAGVNALLNDPPLRREVAAHAIDFGWERHADELADHFDRIIAKRG